MIDHQSKNPLSGFFKTQSDIIALVLIVVLAAAGLLFRQKYLLSLSLFAALINFTLIYFGSRREKQDERILHHRNLAAYHTLIAVFLLVAIMSLLFRNIIIKDISLPFFCRIITWSIGIMYALAYSIIKRLQ
ncbi:MAG: hypothetical protein Q8O74_08835 [bacterium]|nr:hypothetical protein [bacterium]